MLLCHICLPCRAHPQYACKCQSLFLAQHSNPSCPQPSVRFLVCACRGLLRLRAVGLSKCTALRQQEYPVRGSQLYKLSCVLPQQAIPQKKKKGRQETLVRNLTTSLGRNTDFSPITRAVSGLSLFNSGESPTQ